MAELLPFKGIRYNQKISGDLSSNVCPPFDSISPRLQKKLYEISNYNTVRLELGLRGLDEDPYFSAAANSREYLTVGYKGTSPFDAGVFYCPYVPLQMVRATGEDTFQPKIGFKTRYGVVANPFTSLVRDANVYYRKVKVTNLM